MIVVEENIPHATTIVDAAAVTVTASIVCHGLSAGPLTERYVRRLQRRPPRAGLETAETKVIVPVARARWPRTPGR